MKKRVYISVEQNFEQTPPHKYRSSKKIVHLLNEQYELILVNPGDFDPVEATVHQFFKYLGPGKLEAVSEKHVPEGDLFIIYGDETSKNPGLIFGRNFYSCLRNLRSQRRFPRFLNDPDTEESTLKDYLVKLRSEGEFSIADTFDQVDVEKAQELLDRYGQLVFKPIYGCGSAGVKKISSLDELGELGEDSKIKSDYVAQELLGGSEMNVVILDGDFLCSREDTNYHPWSDKKTMKTRVGSPTSFQLDIAKRIARRLKADLLRVDFIGNKVYEINGTGSGLIAVNEEGQQLFDKTSDFVRYVNHLLHL